MRVLAFDTCLDACSAAVWDTERSELHGRFEPMQQGHAERLCPMIDEVLTAGQLDLRCLDAIAVTLGPGTFTGIRIGIAAARGFALATGAPVFAATSLTLLSATVRARLGANVGSGTIAACHDARKGEVLVEISSPGAAVTLDPPALMSPDEAAAKLVAAAPEAFLCGSGAAAVAKAAKRMGAHFGTTPQGIQPDARYMRDLPLQRVSRPSPFYPRPPDARPPASHSLARMP